MARTLVKVTLVGAYSYRLKIFMLPSILPSRPFHMTTLVAERTVQALVSHWSRELWQQKVWFWGAGHLHKGIYEKIKRNIDNKPKTQVEDFVPWIEENILLEESKRL